MHVACGYGLVFLWPSDGIAISYVLRVLQMASSLHTLEPMVLNQAQCYFSKNFARWRYQVDVRQRLVEFIKMRLWGWSLLSMIDLQYIWTFIWIELNWTGSAPFSLKDRTCTSVQFSLVQLRWHCFSDNFQVKSQAASQTLAVSGSFICYITQKLHIMQPHQDESHIITWLSPANALNKTLTLKQQFC